MRLGWKGWLVWLMVLAFVSVSFALPLLSGQSAATRTDSSRAQADSEAHRYLLDVTPEERAPDYPVYLATALLFQSAPHTWRLTSLLTAMAVIFALLLLLVAAAACPGALAAPSVYLASWRMLRAPPRVFRR